jgi:hypothetical protein
MVAILGIERRPLWRAEKGPLSSQVRSLQEIGPGEMIARGFFIGAVRAWRRRLCDRLSAQLIRLGYTTSMYIKVITSLQHTHEYHGDRSDLLDKLI